MPAAVPWTVAVKVHGPLPAVIAPLASVTVVAVKPGVPLQPVPAMAPTAVTVVPAGKVSVNANALCAGLPAPLAMVNVRVLDAPTPMVVVP